MPQAPHDSVDQEIDRALQEKLEAAQTAAAGAAGRSRHYQCDDLTMRSSVVACAPAPARVCT